MLIFTVLSRCNAGQYSQFYPESDMERRNLHLCTAARHVPSSTAAPSRKNRRQGTIYQVYEPIFFQSIGNPFIFRCIDGILIDGNDKGISKCVYRSCSRRDQLGPFKLSDVTWLTPHHRNPLAVGQYVNNCSNDREANVCYQELEVPEDFPIELRQYIPNIKYSHDVTGPLRCVVLVALRDIQKEEELFSNYYTIVH
ncbi:SET domain-containing protein 9 isoform X8 [Ambystoma mexicanum]|uniref:SET domain-containing protein 9 isoform X8 n=1 Tax=Ambystoma mexicanum TaxID=8296 RepID=UPI0037E70EEB